MSLVIRHWSCAFLLISFIFPRIILGIPTEYSKLDNLEINENKNIIGTLNNVFIDSSKLLLINGTKVVPNEHYLWNLSYAPYNTLCPSTELVRPANDVKYHLSLNSVSHY